MNEHFLEASSRVVDNALQSTIVETRYTWIVIVEFFFVISRDLSNEEIKPLAQVKAKADRVVRSEIRSFAALEKFKRWIFFIAPHITLRLLRLSSIGRLLCK